MPVETDKSSKVRHEDLTLTQFVIDYPGPGTLSTMPFREAMGITGNIARTLEDELYQATTSLIGEPSESLVSTIEAEDEPFVKRYAAGKLLGLIGDPRIKLLDPPMVLIDGGQYSIGLDPKDVDTIVDDFKRYGVVRSWIEKETPKHSVDIKPFYIARYPVTNLEWTYFVEDIGQEAAPSSWSFGVMPNGSGNLPVHTISPEWADAYALWLSQKTGREFRLPSEAEWEVAASGSQGREYPWGNKFEADHANTVESGILSATPIGLFPKGATPEGVWDLAGNIEEYVADDYIPYPGGPHVEDNLNEDRTNYRVARGGGYTRCHDLARCKRRHGWFRTDLYIMGMRLAESQ
jgi:formylglycine-generating enzyme required for sulfatase activity